MKVKSIFKINIGGVEYREEKFIEGEILGFVRGEFHENLTETLAIIADNDGSIRNIPIRYLKQQTNEKIQTS